MMLGTRRSYVGSHRKMASLASAFSQRRGRNGDPFNKHHNSYLAFPPPHTISDSELYSSGGSIVSGPLVKLEHSHSETRSRTIASV